MSKPPAKPPAPKVCAVTGDTPAEFFIADPDYGAWVRGKIWLGARAYAALGRLTENGKPPETKAGIIAAIKAELDRVAAEQIEQFLRTRE